MDFILKSFARSMVRITGIRVKAVGVENIDWSKPYIIVFNHTNIFDHFVIYSVLPQIARGVEKESHFRWPIYGLFLRRVGQIPIAPRGDTKRAIAALEKGKELFRKGISVAIAPEGTRSPTGDLLPFKKGAFHLAIDLEADIVAIRLTGMHAFNQKNGFLLNPGDVGVQFFPAISTKPYTKKNVADLRDRIRQLFLDT